MRTHPVYLIRLVATLSLVCCCGIAPLSFGAVDRPAMEKTLDALPSFVYGQKTINMEVLRNAVDEAASNPELRQQLESRFIAILQGQSTRGAKDIACRNLALVGSSKCVPSVAVLLVDPELTHMARYCLEKLGNPEADTAMREALSKVTGTMKIGIISSLGARHDERAIPQLATTLNDTEPEVAKASAFALGRIGTPKAIHTLLTSIRDAHSPLQDYEIQAALVAASKFGNVKDKKPAIEVFKNIFENKLKLEHSERYQAAALAGLVRNESNAEKRFLLPALEGTNVTLRQTAAVLASEPSVNLKPLLASLPTLPVLAQVDLLNSLSSRQTPEIKTAVMPFLDSGTPNVKLAALAALHSQLNVADIPTLAKLTASDNQSVNQEAIKILVSLQDTTANASIVKEFANNNSAVCVQMLNCLAARSAFETAPQVTSLLTSPQSEIRISAVKTLEVISSESQLPAIIKLALNTHSDAEQAAAFAAIRSICERTRGKSLEAVLDGLNQAATKIKPQFFDFLATIGGSRGLEIVLKIASSEKDSTLQTFAIRSLADWSTADAAPHLLNLTKTLKSPELQTIVFRGYIRLCRESEISEADKINLLTEATKVVQSVEQKQLILGALGELSSLDALRIATPFIQDGQVSQEACFACVGIISKFGGQQKAEAAPILKNIIHTAKNPTLIDSVRKQMTRLGISE